MVDKDAEPKNLIKLKVYIYMSVCVCMQVHDCL